MVELMHGGAGMLVCCDNSMTLMSANSKDAAMEKHVPVIDVQDKGICVTVGEVAHPMLDEHYIEWIQLIAGSEVYTHYLNPGDEPTVFFPVMPSSFEVREYCNLHGLWKKEAAND